LKKDALCWWSLMTLAAQKRGELLPSDCTIGSQKGALSFDMIKENCQKRLLAKLLQATHSFCKLQLAIC
jgi:hypothetical protein